MFAPTDEGTMETVVKAIRQRPPGAELMEAGAAVEALMKAEPPLTQEAWHRLQGWYKATADRPPH